MTNDARISRLLWSGLHLAWGSRAFWAYRASIYGAVYFAGIAVIALLGLVGHLFVLLAMVLLFTLGAGAVFLLTINGVVHGSLITAVETEHALLLAELCRQRETPGGHGQIAWGRQRGETADVPPAWLECRARKSIDAIHNAVHDVGDAFPAFAEDRAPAWARALLARCKRPITQALLGRAFASETGHAAYEAKTGLLLYTTVWPRAFRLNMALWVIGQVTMVAVAALLAVPFALATASGPVSVVTSLLVVALWSGYAVKGIFVEPILQAAAITAFEAMVEGSSIAPDTEVVLLEVSEAFRELAERARETAALEEEQSSGKE